MSRERELFPLPIPFDCLADVRSSLGRRCNAGSLSRTTKRRVLARAHFEEWCQEGIRACNELSGFPYSDPPKDFTNSCQEFCFNHVLERYKRVPKPPPDLTPAGALRELCGTASRYDPVGPSVVAPYDKDLVSWPPVGTVAAELAVNLPLADRNIVDGWERHILKDDLGRATYRSSPDRVRPFLEPTLVRRASVYRDFVRRLSESGMVSWRVGGESLLGVFLSGTNLGNCALC